MEDLKIGGALIGYVLIIGLLLSLVAFAFCGVPALAFRFLLTGCFC